MPLLSDTLLKLEQHSYDFIIGNSLTFKKEENRIELLSDPIIN